MSLPSARAFSRLPNDKTESPGNEVVYLFDSFAAARIHVADVVDEKGAFVRVAMKICIALTSFPVGQKSLLVKTRNKVRLLRRMQMLGKMHLTAIKRPSRFLTARLRKAKQVFIQNFDRFNFPYIFCTPGLLY